MFGIIAIIIWAIAAFVAFTGGTVSVLGLVAVGLACWGVHRFTGWEPWHR